MKTKFRKLGFYSIKANTHLLILAEIVCLFYFILITVSLCRPICWISNNNTLDIPCTPNAQEARRQPFEFNFTITIPVI